MSPTEILAIAFGLFLGYWIVSKLVTPKRPAAQDTRETNSSSGTSHASSRGEEPAWFEILQVSPNASVDEIKAAYKTLIRQYHPDKVETLGKDLRDLAEEKSKAINVAYQVGLRARGQ